jgi:sulfatase maturation enzyme AslB (radical SAM superfamily)
MKKIFCDKNWNELNLRFDTGLFKKCCYKQNFIPYTKDFDKDIFENHPAVLKDKNQFLYGEKPPEACSKCLNLGESSYIYTKNSWKDKNKWSEEEIVSLDNESHTDVIEITLSNKCNMTCNYCGPHSSTSWEKYIPLRNITIIDDNQKYKMLDTFYEYIRFTILKNSKQTITYRFKGGEPFLDLNIFDVMENIIEIHSSSEKKILFSFITNLNVKEKIIQNFIEKYKKYINENIKFFMTVSIDGLDFGALEQRDGLDINLWKNNVDILRKNNIYIQFLPTVTNVGLSSLKSINEYCDQTFGFENYKKTWEISINLVNNPFELSIVTLPKSYIKYVNPCLEDCYKWGSVNKFVFETAYYRTLKNIHESIGTNRSQKTLNSVRIFFENLGKIKNKNYFEIYPNLNEILDINAQ